jgi:hypothetical protein
VVDLDSHTIGTLVICATRYAMGRRSTAPSIVCSAVRACWQWMEPQDRSTLVRDLRDELDRAERGIYGEQRTLGARCDHREWLTLLDWCMERI